MAGEGIGPWGTTPPPARDSAPSLSSAAPTSAMSAGAVPPSGPLPPPVDRRLLDAVVSVAGGLELESTLRRIVRAASELTNAPYAALGVLGDDGLHKAFVHTGMDPDMVRRIGHLPRGHGVLGHITRVGRAVRVDDLGTHPASVGFPAAHPPMKSFLGVPVGIGERIVGNLYLADKRGGFTAEDEDVVVALAAAAAVAVDNAGLYEDGRRRERWMAAAQEVSTAMLSGAEEDEALRLIAQRARQVADACASALVLPGWEGQWVLEIADGDGADELVGSVMPSGGRAVSVVRSGEGLRVAELSTEPSLLLPALRAYGPALYAPLVAGDDHVGVLMLLRRMGEREFTDADLATAQTFAGQAALALQLADGRRRSEEAELLQERARISRDLHDLVVQELFAMGMRLGRLREGADEQIATHIDSSLESLDRVVRQIRATIRALRDADDTTGLADRLHGEANRAHIALGFRPHLHVPPAEVLDGLVPPDVADDVVAVVREGLSNAARHARASQVDVTVELDDEEVVVQVADNGVGLAPGADRRSGLENMTERARRHGGTSTTAVNDKGGTTLRWVARLRS